MHLKTSKLTYFNKHSFIHYYLFHNCVTGVLVTKDAVMNKHTPAQRYSINSSSDKSHESGNWKT